MSKIVCCLCVLAIWTHSDTLRMTRPAVAQTDASTSANPLDTTICRSGGGVPTTFDRIIYVDQDDSSCSNSGSGSSTQPFCSIQAAVNAGRPGTAIRIRNAGSPYNESVVVQKSGALGKPIVIEADEGHKPVLTNTVNTGGAGGANNAGVISIVDASYVAVRNLTFNGADQVTSISALFVHAKTHDTTDVVLTGNTITNWAGNAKGRERKSTAILFSRAYPRRVKNSAVRCNVLDGNRFEGIKIIGDDVLVENNRITRMQCGLAEIAGDGLHTNAQASKRLHTITQAIKVTNTSASDNGKLATTALNLTVRDNYIDGVVKDCPYAEMVEGRMIGGGIWCDVGVTGGKVYGNTILNMSGGGKGGGWWGIHIESRCDNWHVYDNLVANRDAPPYSANYRLRNSSGSVFENNISCGGDRAFWIKPNSNKAVTIRNNQVYGGTRVLVADDAVVNDSAFSRSNAKAAMDHSFLTSNRNMGAASCPVRPNKALETQK
jgi:hypothetical protein